MPTPKTYRRNGVRLNPSHDEATRAKIQTSQIINRLHALINGEVKMEPHQVTAALGLLKKTLPDLSAVEHSGELKTRDARELSDAELVAIATGSRPGTAQPAHSEEEPSRVH